MARSVRLGNPFVMRVTPIGRQKSKAPSPFLEPNPITSGKMLSALITELLCFARARDDNTGTQAVAGVQLSTTGRVTKLRCATLYGDLFTMKNFQTSTIAVLLGGVLLISAVASAQVHHDQCEHRIHSAEAKLRKAVRNHGEHSKQARRQREELERVRHQCGMDRDQDHDRR